MKILHVLVDSIFIDVAVREFEAVSPGSGLYITVGAKATTRNILSLVPQNVDEAEFVRYIYDHNVSAVIFHSLASDKYRLLDNIPKHVKVFWLGWGYDYYDLLLKRLYPNGLILPKTQSLCGLGSSKSDCDKGRDYLKYLRHISGLYRRINVLKSLRRVDYFIPVLDLEYQLVIENNPWFRASYLTWNYCTVEDDMSSVSPRVNHEPRDIMLGNSATPTNNHVEAFELIKNNIDLDGRRIIVPLGYGDVDYKNKILKAGYKMLGSSFYPLTDFVGKSEYIEIVGMCEYVIMNHLRQQGLGNICIGALVGARIILNPKNPLYSWLPSKGISVGDINSMSDESLNEIQKNENRKAIKDFWGRDAQRKKTRDLLNVALN